MRPDHPAGSLSSPGCHTTRENTMSLRRNVELLRREKEHLEKCCEAYRDEIRDLKALVARRNHPLFEQVETFKILVDEQVKLLVEKLHNG
jgi:predicted RNase H-like nuclease (RuvC/YqgF family)